MTGLNRFPLGYKIAGITGISQQERNRYMLGSKPKFSQKACFALTTLVSVLAASPACAFRPPASGLAVDHLLEGGNAGKQQGSFYNISYMPVLLELARLLGRYQLPPNMFFYIENESFSNYPGIDLRSLLLKQSGPLKVPEGMRSTDGGLPNQLAVHPILAAPPLVPNASESLNMSDGQVPQLAVEPLGESDSISVQPVEPPAQVASPDKIKVAVQGNELTVNPPLFLDIHGMAAPIGQADAQLTANLSELPRLRSTFPALLAFGEAVHSSTPFIFWTCHQSKLKAQLSGRYDSANRSAFQGTFVACLESSQISWIRNRHIGLQQGRALAANRGGDLGVDTALGSVSIEPGAACVVEYNDKKKLLRVIALESRAPGRIVVDIRRPDGAGGTVRLLAGEALFVGEHDLSREDMSGSEGLPLSDAREKDKSVIARFTISEMLSRDILLDAKNSELTSQQKSALLQLRQRLTAQNMAGQVQEK